MSGAVMPAPCESCPFTRKPKAIRLSASRAREIGRNALSDNGGAFACHKTTIDGDDGDAYDGPHAKECAGSLLFGHKQGRYNQVARVLGRIGAFNPDRMQGAGDVFDSLGELVQSAHPETRPRRRRSARQV